MSGQQDLFWYQIYHEKESVGKMFKGSKQRYAVGSAEVTGTLTFTII